jgi:hypothetical protein
MATNEQYMLSRMARIAAAVNRFAVQPWKRTVAIWTAIIFNEAGQFAVITHNGEQHLPSGQIMPDGVSEHQCLSALGLSDSDFVMDAPLRLLHIDGQGARGFTFYFSAQLRADGKSTRRFEHNISYTSRADLTSFIPTEVLDKLQSIGQTSI